MQKGKFILLGFYILSCIIYLGWRTSYTLPLDCGLLSISFGIILLITEMVGFIETIIFYMTIINTDCPATPEVDTDDYPDVDVFVATYNEPAELLYKTIVGCKCMHYPQPERVHIYICDDGHREEIVQLCDKMQVGYITRSENTHAKAGNLNNALNYTSSPYVVTFDADMIPMHDFLLKSIPFFLTGEKVGFVQLPQNFYNPDPFQYNLYSENNIPNEQELFFQVIQAGKNRYNAVIYAGSNTVISRASLNDIGGFVVGTITEDFATGILIQNQGYKGVYLNEVHASGLSPESMEDLYSQRIRWGRGMVLTFKAFNPFRLKGLGIIQKMMYCSALSYWYFGIWRFVFLMAPILYTVFGVTILNAQIETMLLIWAPMFILSYFAFKLFTNNVRTMAWGHIYDTILFPHLIKGVLAETLGFKMAKFKVTPKDSVIRDRFINKFHLVWVQIVLAALSLTGLIKIIYMWATYGYLHGYPINSFWLGYNLYLLSMAIFFASERPKFRSTERMNITADAIIQRGGRSFAGMTQDISETGVSIMFDQPIFLEPDDIHAVAIETDRFEASFSTKIIQVTNIGNKYKYGFAIHNILEQDYQRLLQILYDRVPVSVHTIRKDGIVRNIYKNLYKRSQPMLLWQRKLPRVSVEREFAAYNGDDLVFIHIHDFNYMYIAVTAERKPYNLRIPLSRICGVELSCVLLKESSDSKNKYKLIYYVTNYQDIINVAGLVDMLRRGGEVIDLTSAGFAKLSPASSTA